MCNLILLINHRERMKSNIIGGFWAVFTFGKCYAHSLHQHFMVGILEASINFEKNYYMGNAGQL